jgi:hypothetical protein
MAVNDQPAIDIDTLHCMYVQVMVSEVIRAVQPDMKIVVILREPVSRMYSAFWYYGCLYGNPSSIVTPESFHSSVEEEVHTVTTCVERGSSMRKCARQSYGTAQQLVKGMYAAFAPDWLAVYPPEQIMWIRAEDYYADERSRLQVWLPGHHSAGSDCILVFSRCAGLGVQGSKEPHLRR